MQNMSDVDPWDAVQNEPHRRAKEDSAILFQNAARTVFLVDIPTSIALAQELQPSQEHGFAREDLPRTARRKRYLLSSPPLTVPYPTPPEPKTEAARARVLARIPAAERSFHAEVIEPLVRNGLRELREEYARNQGHEEASWCLPRRIREEEEAGSDAPGSSSSNHLERKRKSATREDDVSSAMSFAPIEPDPAYTTTSQRHRSDDEPPLILSPGLNDFESLKELQNLVVKNTSTEPVTIRCSAGGDGQGEREKSSQPYRTTTFTVAPKSTFLLCTLPIARRPEESIPSSRPVPIPGLLAERKFNLILLDPPWPNRSVRRSAQYPTHHYADMATLTRYIGEILRTHLYSPDAQDGKKEDSDQQRKKSQESIAAIWVTNTERSRTAAYDAIHAAGLTVSEEWVWIKTTVKGEPVTPVDGLWRKPYEILIIGKRCHGPGETTTTGDGKTRRRVIAAVPDLHSRKPNLREIFESVFFSSPSASPSPAGGASRGCHRVEYSALEVFARNLTAGWWACGNEVLKFHWDGWWVDG
ncbi:hypothetical protein VTN02DRAFT_5479 [Thermoascus thermophilus]